MEKIKIILNPSSGKQLTERKVDYLTKLLLDDGYMIAKYMTKKKDDAMRETIKTCKEDWDIIIACGGDGTVNEVAKGIAKSERKIPVAILSTGTVNDFANYMNIPNNVNDFFEMIKRRKIVDIDIGKSGDDYFVNVAAGGILTNVGYQVQPEAKAILGRMAYYFEGLIELVREGLAPINVKFESEEYNSQEKILLFLISNSSSIGGFKRLAPDADVLDGLLDVLIIKNSDVPELANIFFNVLRGGHINHPNVIYFKTRDIKISSDKDISLDIDGEYGGKLPANFQVCSKAMKIFI
jgi:diacylglycerol kinase (ATP)